MIDSCICKLVINLSRVTKSLRAHQVFIKQARDTTVPLRLDTLLEEPRTFFSRNIGPIERKP